MPVNYLAQMRPLFLVAVLLSWNAAAFAINATPSEEIPLSAALLLGLATLALAVVSIRAQKDAWAQTIVLRPGANQSEVSPCLFFIGFLSFLFSVWIGLNAWESAAQQSVQPDRREDAASG
jgi:hypothetical protein